jgi:hypothetical protein
VLQKLKALVTCLKVKSGPEEKICVKDEHWANAILQHTAQGEPQVGGRALPFIWVLATITDDSVRLPRPIKPAHRVEKACMAPAGTYMHKFMAT